MTQEARTTRSSDEEAPARPAAIPWPSPQAVGGRAASAGKRLSRWVEAARPVSVRASVSQALRERSRKLPLPSGIFPPERASAGGRPPPEAQGRDPGSDLNEVAEDDDAEDAPHGDDRDDAQQEAQEEEDAEEEDAEEDANAETEEEDDDVDQDVEDDDEPQRRHTRKPQSSRAERRHARKEAKKQKKKERKEKRKEKKRELKAAAAKARARAKARASARRDAPEDLDDASNDDTDAVPEAADPMRPMALQTMTRADEEDGIPCSWGPCDASTFQVRQLGYARHHQKAPSEPALYECVGTDLLRDSHRIASIAEKLQLPHPRAEDDLDLIRESGLPRLFVVNVQVPLKAPGPWSGADAGVSLVWYFSVRPETVARAVDASTHSPDVDLLRRFTSEFATNEDIRRRFKAIGIALNFDELGLSSKLAKFNGKPVILFRTAQVQRGTDFVEVTVKVHKFNMLARGIFHQFRELSSKVRIRGAFLLQGEDDDSELPEVILGCAALHHLDFEAATPLADFGVSLDGPIGSIAQEALSPDEEAAGEETSAFWAMGGDSGSGPGAADGNPRASMVWDVVSSISDRISASFYGTDPLAAARRTSRQHEL